MALERSDDSKGGLRLRCVGLDAYAPHTWPRACKFAVGIGVGLIVSMWGAAHADAQSTIVGRVVSDTARQPIAGATITIPTLGLSAIADSTGAFKFTSVPPGDHLTIVRAFGFGAETTLVELGSDEAFARDFVLRRLAVTLGAVRVSARSDSVVAGKLRGFHERRESQVGHFLDSTDIAKWANRRAGDVLSTIPGIDLRRAAGRAHAVGSRAQPSLTNDRRTDPCYMDVYIDGALVYTKSLAGTPPFDLNSISVEDIVAIEAYASAARIPAQFNKTSKGCGVILIWTR